MMLIAALASVAIVTQDQAALRAAPRDSAAQQAVLWQGDTLEIRAERMDYLQVYDHRRERAGYIRASQVKTTSLRPDEAPELLSVLRFVRDTPGAEALGIGYAAAYLKAAPANSITAEPFDAIGSMAERLARRASAGRQGKAGETVASHLEVAAQYGVTFKSYERNGSGDVVTQLCYEGEAFRRVVGLAPTPEQRARAVLGLTRADCIDPNLRPGERLQLDRWRADVLEQVDGSQFAALPETLKNRLRMRRAGVWAELAFEQARAAVIARTPAQAAASPAGPAASGGVPMASQLAAQRAIAELAGINKAELSDDDGSDYTDAAIRVGASRWAAEPVLPSTAPLAILTEPGQPGETCVALIDVRPAAAASKTSAKTPLARRCTYGTVWPASASVQPAGRAVTLAVQTLAAWRELWVFRRQGDAWTIDVLPPAPSNPELGYIEFAGWVPGGDKLLTVREAHVEGRVRRSFEVTNLDTLGVDKQASSPALLVLFTKWQDPAWKRASVSLR